jgi:endonuclease YncB( thermonuclease family)
MRNCILVLERKQSQPACAHRKGEWIMKRLVCLILFALFLSACMPSQPAIVPAETLAAQTLAARPTTAAPPPTATTEPTASPTVDQRPPTPALDLTLPGAYCLPPASQRSQGLVTRVLSGDTIEVATGNETWLVRFIGLDAPNVTAPAEWQGPQSMNFTGSLLGGKTVTLVQDISDIDPEGYRPRYVIADGTFVNFELLRQGFAMQRDAAPDLACKDAFLAAQVEAQGAVRGVWQPTPLPTFTLPPTATITLTPGPVTPTTRPPCDCRRFYSCNNFDSQREAQTCFNYCINNGFGPVLRDQNNNGLVCEGS